MIIAVYAPHDPRDKRMLWDYLAHVINQWQGEVVIMGDFNEVRVKSDRFGTNFNVLGANIFNSFINSTGLEEVHLGGAVCITLAVIKLATKMSKLDRFFESNNCYIFSSHCGSLWTDSYPITDDFLEMWPLFWSVPFRFFHHGFISTGFNDFVTSTWNSAPSVDSYLWNGLHGGGITIDGVWKEQPNDVKQEFLSHFQDRFAKPSERRANIDMRFSKKLFAEDQKSDIDLEREVSKKEINRLFGACGKSPPEACRIRHRVSSAPSAKIPDGAIRENQFDCLVELVRLSLSSYLSADDGIGIWESRTIFGGLCSFDVSKRYASILEKKLEWVKVFFGPDKNQRSCLGKSD
ncbi:RNA-directed DNA polymerase, eukaryota [Tanacetum coccineum]